MQDLEPGQVIDGFRLDEPLDPGGMASFWRVRRPATDMPLLMKIPLMRRGEDPITIVGFEVAQMILARLSGPHVPRVIAAGDFERPYLGSGPGGSRRCGGRRRPAGGGGGWGRSPPPPRRWNRDSPPWLQEIILRCLEIDPDARYATAAQLAFDLQHPEQVALTARAERQDRDGLVAVGIRPFRARKRRPAPRPPPPGPFSPAPLLTAAPAAPPH